MCATSCARPALAVTAVLVCLIWCAGWSPAVLAAGHDVTVSRVHVVARYPHDPAAFTQGLLFYNGYLYESTGRYGHSSVRRVDIGTGRVLARNKLPARYFGEGLARVGNQLIQLTWKAGIAYVYTLPGLDRIGLFHYAGQGWGLTWNGQRLIMSDGSSTLRFLNPDTFEVTRRVQVTRNGQPVDQINELEYIDGEIWANVLGSDNIIRIDPDTGRVTGIVHAGHLRRWLPSDAGVLNGIAWDPLAERLFITGKNWPTLFRVRVPGVG